MKGLIALGVAVASAAGFFVANLVRDVEAGAIALPVAAAVAPGTTRVYTANFNTSSVSVLDGATLEALPEVEVGGPQAIAVSPDGLHAYACGDGSMTEFDTATQHATGYVIGEDIMSDIVVSPDNSKVYLTAEISGVVVVFDAVARTISTNFPLDSNSSGSPSPVAIDITPDGASLFVLEASDSLVQRVATDDGAGDGTVVVSSSARELKVSTDGATLIVVGGGRAQFFRTSDLSEIIPPIAGDFGDQLDLDVAGSRVYVLNAQFVDLTAGKGGPKAFPADGSPSIDVYETATGTWVESIDLGLGSSVMGIAVLTDGSCAYVSRAGAENEGSVQAVDLTNGTLGATGPTRNSPRRVALKEVIQTIPVVSYTLPRSVNLAIKGAGKDSFVASGFYDDGGAVVDYTKPFTVDIGPLTKTFTPVASKNGKKFTFKDANVTVTLLPNYKGSSRGKFIYSIKKTTLGGVIAPTATLDFHFKGTGLPDAEGTVKLTTGKYRFSKARGALVSPLFFPVKATAKLGAANLDSFKFLGGFASNGITPPNLASIRFSFGAFSKTVTTLTRTGDTYAFKSPKGQPPFSIKVDFLREKVTVSGSKIELGPLDAPTVDVLLEAGSGAIRNTVRLASKGVKRNY